MDIQRRSQHRRRRRAASGNGLLNTLIAYWPGDEANGNALDAHTNALTLTDTNTVTSNPGLVYALARQYTAANSEGHTRPGDDALLSMGDVDMTLAAWVYMASKPAAEMYIASKWRGAAGAREYRLEWLNTSDRLTFSVRDIADTTISTASANTLGAPSLATWYLVIGYHDSVANTIGISVNNGAVDIVATAGGIQNTAEPFCIGFYVPNPAAGAWNGRIGPTMLWKSAAGGGGVLSGAQRTALYNNGAGLTYAQLTT